MNNMKLLVAAYVFLIGLSLSGCSRPAVPFIHSATQQAWSEIDSGALLVDVRSPEEFAAGHLPGALNIPHDQIENRIFEVMSAKDRSVVLYCRSGRRSGIAKETLERIGFTKVLNAGGYEELKAAKKSS